MHVHFATRAEASRWKFIGKVRHPDLDARACDADGTDEQAHSVLLAREHMLDRRAHGGAPGIGFGNVLGQRPTRHAALVNIAL